MLKGIPHQVTAWLIFIAIGGGYFLMATTFPLAYIVATYEDLVGEWAQVFLFATTMLFSVRLAFTKSNHRLFFGVLALACFYVVGEEISWGQRIFDISTPEFFKEHNLQNETNLHNFLTGPINTWTKQALEFGLAAGLTGYGLLYPYLLRMRWKLALWFSAKGLPHPPLYLWPFFVTSAILELGPFSFNEAEVAEILIPLALAIMALNYLLAIHQKKDLQSDPGWDPAASAKLARQTAVTVLSVLVLALGTTAASYASPTLGPKIESRYMNGVEKFANRYKRLGNWPVALELYSLAQQNEPLRADLLRELYRCHIQLDNKEKALEFLRKAELVELDYLAKNTLSVEAHLSLVETYELLEEPRMAEDHLRGSLEIALLHVKRNPYNASAAYWLGRTQEKNGNLPVALQAYQQATKLQPGILRYQKAALSLGHKLKEATIGAESAADD